MHCNIPLVSYTTGTASVHPYSCSHVSRCLIQRSSAVPRSIYSFSPPPPQNRVLQWIRGGSRPWVFVTLPHVFFPSRWKVFHNRLQGWVEGWEVCTPAGINRMRCFVYAQHRLWLNGMLIIITLGALGRLRLTLARIYKASISKWSPGARCSSGSAARRELVSELSSDWEKGGI